MTTWDSIPVSNLESMDLEAEEIDQQQVGLKANVEDLHGQFLSSATHLSEVEHMHKQVLLNAGMIPEDHIANTEPTLQLEWFVKELNGRLNPDGLTLPMYGVESDNIELFTRQIDNNTIVKLKITEIDGKVFEREIILPTVKETKSINANFFNNRLHLRW